MHAVARGFRVPGRATVAVALWLVAGIPGVSAAQATAPTAEPQADAGRTVRVVPNAAYDKGTFHRLFFGSHYRDVWKTPIDVEVLDLERFGGGLRPLKRGGGEQTKSIRFRAADGSEFVFRSIDKDPAGALPPDLRGTLANDIVQDQISSALPAGPLVAAALLEAVGVPHPHPHLVVLPDDARLGELRQDFAGMLGFIEERPTEGRDGAAGFGGYRDVIGSDEMWKRLEKHPRDRVDSRALLEARLLDLFMGDWDRHREQWRWGRREKGDLWEPIPRDRDQVFARLDGLVLDAARRSTPQLVSFGAHYDDLFGLTWNARDVDRRLLTDLERPTWDSIAGALQRRLTDSVIDDAVHRLPPEHYALVGRSLTGALRRRRDDLPRVAERFYRMLAEQVDIRCTDEVERLEVDRLPDGGTEVRITVQGDGMPYYRRHFVRGETKELRVHLRGGADSTIVRGTGSRGIRLRVVGGGGDDRYDDSSHAGGRRATFYDDRGDNSFALGEDASVDRRAPPPTPEVDSGAPPPRDWGERWLPLEFVSLEPSIGLLVGAGVSRYGYEFRRYPFGTKTTARLAFATGPQRFRFDIAHEVRPIDRSIRWVLYGRASGIDVVRFYGFGNETPLVGTNEFHRVRQQQYRLEPAIVWLPHRALTFQVGPVLRYATTDLTRGDIIAQLRPYGSDAFGQVGAQGSVRWDVRDRPVAATSGAYIAAGGSFYPPWWDVASSYGEARAEAAAYLTARRMPGQPTLALRAGGKKVWGRFPFFDAATVGGAATVRGFPETRFSGDASAYGNVELRLRLGRPKIVLPGDFGVFGLTDVGRVFVSGQSSSKWHVGAGGGVWFAPVSAANTLSIAIARSGEHTGVYVRAGFVF